MSTLYKVRRLGFPICCSVPLGKVLLVIWVKFTTCNMQVMRVVSQILSLCSLSGALIHTWYCVIGKIGRKGGCLEMPGREHPAGTFAWIYRKSVMWWLVLCRFKRSICRLAQDGWSMNGAMKPSSTFWPGPQRSVHGIQCISLCEPHIWPYGGIVESGLAVSWYFREWTGCIRSVSQ